MYSPLRFNWTGITGCGTDGFCAAYRMSRALRSYDWPFQIGVLKKDMHRGGRVRMRRTCGFGRSLADLDVQDNMQDGGVCSS